MPPVVHSHIDETFTLEPDALNEPDAQDGLAQRLPSSLIWLGQIVSNRQGGGLVQYIACCVHYCSYRPCFLNITVCSVSVWQRVFTAKVSWGGRRITDRQKSVSPGVR